MSRWKQIKTILMDKKLRESANVSVEIMYSKRKNLVTCKNSRFPFDVNLMLNLSNTKLTPTFYPRALYIS